MSLDTDVEHEYPRVSWKEFLSRKDRTPLLLAALSEGAAGVGSMHADFQKKTARRERLPDNIYTIGSILGGTLEGIFIYAPVALASLYVNTKHGIPIMRDIGLFSAGYVVGDLTANAIRTVYTARTGEPIMTLWGYRLLAVEVADALKLAGINIGPRVHEAYTGLREKIRAGFNHTKEAAAVVGLDRPLGWANRPVTEIVEEVTQQTRTRGRETYGMLTQRFSGD